MITGAKISHKHKNEHLDRVELRTNPRAPWLSYTSKPPISFRYLFYCVLAYRLFFSFPVGLHCWCSRLLEARIASSTGVVLPSFSPLHGFILSRTSRFSSVVDADLGMRSAPHPRPLDHFRRGQGSYLCSVVDLFSIFGWGSCGPQSWKRNLPCRFSLSCRCRQF